MAGVNAYAPCALLVDEELMSSTLAGKFHRKTSGMFRSGTGPVF